MTKRIGLSLLSLVMMTMGCGLRSLPQGKNHVEAAVAEVTNQYKRRADLVPNLVEVVKGYAKHERETLEGVVNARAKATQVTLDPTKMTAAKLKEFTDAQGELTAALGRLMVVVERYPDLKANQNFLELQAQLEGAENRITVARKRYIDSIEYFNNLVTAPPESWTNSVMYHFEKMPQWSVTEAEKAKVEQPPAVKF